MRDQAETLRRMVRQRSPGTEPPSRQGGLLLVYGCAPGIGASTISWNLALRWKRLGQPAAWIDGNRQRPAVAQLGSLVPRASLVEILSESRMVREAWETGPYGVPILAGSCNGMPRHVALSQHPAILDQLRLAARQQLLLVDVGDLAELQTLVPVADHCIFVSTADAECLTAAYAAIKQVTGPLRQARCWLAVNRTVDVAQANGAQERLKLTCDRHLNLALDTLGQLPFDPQLTPAFNHGGLGSSLATASPTFRQALDRCGARLESALMSCYRGALGEVVV